MATQESKQLTIFGSTGPSGTLLAKAALREGYNLVLFVRSPNKLPQELKGEKVTVVVGNLDEEAKIKEAVGGSVCVLLTLGPAVSFGPFPNGRTPIADGTKLILSALEDDQKFIAIATASAFRTGDKRGVLWSVLVGCIKYFARTAYDEIVGIGKAVSDTASKSSTVLVRIPVLGDNPDKTSPKGVKVSPLVGIKSGIFSKTGEDCGKVGTSLLEDLAEFMLDCVTTETWNGKSPAVSS